MQNVVTFSQLNIRFLSNQKSTPTKQTLYIKLTERSKEGN